MATNPVKILRKKRVWNAKSVGLAVLFLQGLGVAWCQQGGTGFAAPPLMAAKAGSNSEVTSGTPKANVGDYTITPEDLLDVSVMGVPEVSRTYRVSSNGFLTLPLVPEPFYVTGDTLDQLEHVIAQKYKEAGMINNAVVSVSLKETRLHAVLVTGEVAHPEPVPIYGSTHLLDVLIQAGGLSTDAGDEVIIRRGDMGLREEAEENAAAGAEAEQVPTHGRSFTLNIRKLMMTGDDVTNIRLYPGDRVTVERAELVYIMGAVGRPGGYVLNESRQNITVMKALIMAGDVGPNAKRNHIVLMRRNPAGPEEKRVEIPVNYKAIVKGQIPDMKLQPDDILYIPESGSLKAMHQGVNTAVAVATGGASWLLIYH